MLYVEVIVSWIRQKDVPGRWCRRVNRGVEEGMLLLQVVLCLLVKVKPSIVSTYPHITNGYAKH